LYFVIKTYISILVRRYKLHVPLKQNIFSNCIMVVIMNIPFAHSKFDSKSTLYTFSGIFVTYFTYGGYKSGRLIRFLHKKIIVNSGADPGFQVRRGALKKIAPSGRRCVNFWRISCEKSRFYPKNSYFFQF
jgi:hypothetical protein